MKRSTFIAIFMSANVAFIILHIHKHSHMIKLSYTKQKKEIEKLALQKQKQELTHQISTLYDRKTVKQFAKNKLELEDVKIGQMKKMPHDTNV